MYKRCELNPAELSDTLMRIIGEIEPIGSHDIDKQRMQNLIKLCDTIDCLLDEIMGLVQYKNRPEASMKDVGEYAERWLADKSVWTKDTFMVPESTKEVLNDFGVYSNLKYIGAFSKIPDTSSIGNICTVDNITYVHDGKKWHVIGKVWFGKEDEWDTLPVEERIQYDVIINLDYFKKFSYDEPLPCEIEE